MTSRFVELCTPSNTPNSVVITCLLGIRLNKVTLFKLLYTGTIFLSSSYFRICHTSFKIGIGDGGGVFVGNSSQRTRT